MYYAQINDENICFAVTQTAGIIEQTDMIQINVYDESLLGKKRVGNTWEDVPMPEPQPQPEQGA